MEILSPIGTVAPLPMRPADSSEVSKAKSGFGDILTSTIEQVNRDQISGDQAIQKLQAGDASHLHEVMIAVEEADVSLRMLVQMRNRAQQAYDEIMRMQI